MNIGLAFQDKARVAKLEADVEKLRNALAPFANEVAVTADGKFRISSDRKRACATDLLRARNVYDLTAKQN